MTTTNHKTSLYFNEVDNGITLVGQYFSEQYILAKPASLLFRSGRNCKIIMGLCIVRF